MASDEEDFDGDFDSDGKVDSDGEVDSSEEEDVVGKGKVLIEKYTKSFRTLRNTLVSILFHNHHLHLQVHICFKQMLLD